MNSISTNSSFQQMIYMLGLMLFVFIADSQWLVIHFDNGQWVANVVTLAYFMWMYNHASQRIKRTMMIAVVVASIGEMVLCMLLGMYEYRLENIPLYVPLGHAILYTTIWYLSRDPWYIRKLSVISPILLVLSILYTLCLLVVYNDVYGSICTVFLLLILAYSAKLRPFFLLMFFAVVYLEQLGTFFECWYWHPTLLNQANWIPSGNPPSGVSLFYVVLDILCLGVYLLFHPKLSLRWKKVVAAR